LKEEKETRRKDERREGSMGNCSSETATQRQSRRDQKEKSLDIDKCIAQDAKKEDRIATMLLLGLKDSGTEIVWRDAVKQAASNTNEHVELIRTNILVWMKDLIVSCETLGIEFEAAENVSIAQEVKSQRFQKYQLEFFDEDTVEKIQSLWRDAGVRDALRRSGLPEPEKVGYFMDNVDRFVMRRDERRLDDGTEWSLSVVPVELREEDVVKLYTPSCSSSSLREIRYSTAFNTTRLIDMSDFLLKKARFKHYFEYCDLVVFCAALDQFDEIILSDEHKNDDTSTDDNTDNGDKTLLCSGLSESLRYFNRLLHLPLYECSYVVLLFNKDVFESKFEKSENGLSSFRSSFPDYPGSPIARDAIQFITDKFTGLVQRVSSVPISIKVHVVNPESETELKRYLFLCMENHNLDKNLRQLV